MDSEQESRDGSMLGMVLGVAIILLLAAALSVPVLLSARSERLKRSCAENLRQLGTYLDLYVNKYGCESAYPTQGSDPNFLNYLREIPNTSAAVASGKHELFVCPVLGTNPGPVALDYRYPRRMSFHDTPPRDMPLACDRATNHDPEGQGDINVLLFDGSVTTATPKDHLWDSCVGPGSGKWMQGP
ncbi:MAG: hypothetical protein RDV41_04815 [Planctomycetota bacterium]|nr:hypothetical protein [Planctomycetota bacterium]